MKKTLASLLVLAALAACSQRADSAQADLSKCTITQYLPSNYAPIRWKSMETPHYDYRGATVYFTDVTGKKVILTGSITVECYE
jgi:hypothetical protein